MGISSRERTVQRQGPEIRCCIPVFTISGARKVNGSRFIAISWTSTVRNLTCLAWILTEATPPYAAGRSRLSGKEKRKTTNALYLTDRAASRPCPFRKSGKHHDTHNIVAVMNMMEDMAKANIRTDGLFLNADAGFDCAALRPC